MSRCGGSILLASILIFASGPAGAQVKINNTNFQESQAKVRPQSVRPDGLGSIGYVVGDGIVIAPTLQTEAGHDSNPDRLFNGESSAYGLVDGGVTLGIVGTGMATTVSLKGSYINYEGLDRDDRFDAGGSVDTYYLIQPGHELTGGAFYLRDEINFTKNEVIGSYSEYNYTGELAEGFLTSRYSNVRYLNGDGNVPLTPLFLNSSFDVEKFEQQGGFLFGRNQIVGIFVRGAYANVNYTDQRDESLVDRDGNDYWGVAGLRITFSPWLRADLGLRGNRRDIEDKTIGSVNTTGFDGALTWAPSAWFQLKLTADRYLGEPSAALSRVADTHQYAAQLQYRPIARATLSMRAAYREYDEIGSGFTFEEHTIVSDLSYDLTQGVQLYLAALYERTTIEQTEAEYDRFRIGAGTRIRFNNHTFDPIVAGALGQPVPEGQVEVGIGYSAFFLPEVRFTKRTDAFVTQTVGEVTDHDGGLDGFKVDAAYRDFASFYFADGTPAKFSFKGFYGHYSATDRSSCYVDLAPNGLDCLFFNVVDPGAGDSNTGPFGSFSTRTQRSLHYWGTAVEARFDGDAVSYVRDWLSFVDLSALRVGVDFRALQQKTELFAIDTTVPDPVDYDEDLDTYYYGAYVGYDRRFDFGRGLSFGIGAQGGLYYADTDYDANYQAFIPVGPNAYVTDWGRLKLERSDVAFIGSASLDLTQQFRWGSVGLFGEVEYLSKTPRMRYRDQELDGGFPFDITGPNASTSIDVEQAWNYTVGSRITVPLNN